MTMFRFGCGHVIHDEAIHDAQWGARLIYSEVVPSVGLDGTTYPGSSGVVWDRQTPDGDPTLVESLFPVVERAMEEFRKVHYELSSDSSGRLCWREGQRLVVMSPQGSYGYLYVTAVLEKPDHIGETQLTDHRRDGDRTWRELGNWPQRVVDEANLKAAAQRASRIEYLERELKWLEQDVHFARTDRARKLRQKKVDTILAEIEDVKAKLA
jgi:hypothetical protein